jgi:hypothetical protein
MKKILILFVCACVLIVGGFLMSAMSRPPKKAITSGVSNESVNNTLNKGKLTTKQKVVRQEKILNKVEKDLTIKKNPYIGPGSTPKDLHPSGQF